MNNKDLKEQIKDTKKKLELLREENIKLKDELESLWSMMDELNESDIKNWSHIMDDIKKDLEVRTLMTTTKKADC